MTEELWQQLGHTEQLAYHAWPTYDEAKCTEQTIEIAVQVNGKVKARIHVPAAIESADAIAQAKAEPAVAEAIAGKTIAKEIYVKGKAGQHRRERLRLCSFFEKKEPKKLLIKRQDAMVLPFCYFVGADALHRPVGIDLYFHCLQKEKSTI